MMKEIKTGVFDYNEESYNFEFKTSLSAYEKMVFVKTVVDNLVDDNGYDAIIKDLVFDFTIIDMFTNIDTSFVNMQDDDGNDVNPIIIIEHFLNKTNVVDIVKENMEDGLLDKLIDAVDLDIQYLTGINTNPINKSIANLISTLEKKANDIDLGSAMDMVQKFVGMTEELTPESVMNAYINSITHKNNLAEIEEAKNTK